MIERHLLSFSRVVMKISLFMVTSVVFKLTVINMQASKKEIYIKYWCLCHILCYSSQADSQ